MSRFRLGTVLLLEEELPPDHLPEPLGSRSEAAVHRHASSSIGGVGAVSTAWDIAYRREGSVLEPDFRKSARKGFSQFRPSSEEAEETRGQGIPAGAMER
jgi:hypothetical protein